ncbi:MAG: metal-sulfur cluster assembly factor [Planctomycetaceae bacterium]
MNKLLPSCLTRQFRTFASLLFLGLVMQPTLLLAQGTPSAKEMTDSFETKMKLLEQAWKNKDYDLARSLTHSLRDTVKQTQNEEEIPGESLIDVATWKSVDALGAAGMKWAQGWKYFKAVTISESVGEPRTSEPVDLFLSFPAEQTTSLAREIRVARVSDGSLTEVTSQVYGEIRRGDQRFCNILWMVDSEPNQQQTYLVFYGNPDAELPEYPSDLNVEGEGFGLDISNAFFKVALSKQTGQIERLILEREHGMELYSGGEGHGEPAGIDWAHDYVDEGSFQKLRISLWETCPDFEVIKGPLCTIVRRWGFPYSPVHPLYSPARLNVDIEYRFYAGLPWFHKYGEMTAVQDFEPAALRDDEWVFTGQSFTHKLWMDPEGELHIGDVTPEMQTNLWGVGFYNQETQDSFMSLFLQHEAEGLPELSHAGAPTLYYRWHGQLWSRYPLSTNKIPAGAVLKQKNAYLSVPFTPEEGSAQIEQTRRAMMHPLELAAGDALPKLGQKQTGRLARAGEGGEQSEMKQAIWNALRDCKDAQLYTADINVVDLGLVYDVRVRGDVVILVMAMPHRGRPLLDYFINGSIEVHPTPSMPVRQRLEQLPGIRQVVVKQTWEPGWSSNRLTDEGRKKMGFE